jgi:hypothetical protein
MLYCPRTISQEIMGEKMKNNLPKLRIRNVFNQLAGLVTAALTISLLATNQVLADDFRSVGIELTSDDNLSRSQPGEELSSLGLSGTYSLGSRKQLSDTSSLRRVYRLGIAYYPSYTGYSNLSAEAQFSYKKKTGLGPQAWWWSGGANAGYAFYSDGNRSNFYLRGDLSVGKRFGERTGVSAGYAIDQASAGDAVYSISGQGPKANIDFTISERWLAYASWKSRTGDSWMATGLGDPGGPDKAPWISDSTFTGYQAYRKDSTGTETKYGVNYVLNDQSSVDFSYMKRSVQVKGTSSWYYNNIYAVSYFRSL